ncbi:MAG: DNA-deoxyinosine glycosylase [Mariprofundaceae bacterium]|nr:DNA-deoxyinosine glycosylase [Mariprofundaceae bacterium]
MQSNPHSPEHGFASVSKSSARILILGSMPGRKSLDEQQYYAHPRNAFWAIMGELFGFYATMPYAQRLEQLADQHVALWDVTQHCIRPGSLDAAIRDATANDFRAFLTAHPQIHAIFFNGRKAEELFRRLVLPGLADKHRSIERHTLPSTSPAHAAYTFEKKLEAWGIIRTCLEPLTLPSST